MILKYLSNLVVDVGLLPFVQLKRLTQENRTEITVIFRDTNLFLFPFSGICFQQTWWLLPFVL